MKSLFYAMTLLALLGSYAARAQTITNAGFETWATRNGAESPTGWLTTADTYGYYYQSAASGFQIGAVTKSTDAHGGTYAAKLTSTSAQAGGAIVVVPGSLILGAKTGIYNFFEFPIGGAGYATRPTQMQFYYKNSGASTDSAFALVYLSKSTSGVPMLLGAGVKLLAPASAYTALTVPISYDPNNSSVPDSIHIVFTSGYGGTLFNGQSGAVAFPSNIKAGSTLLVDDIVISGAALATRADASTQALLTVAPNPSPGGRFVISSPDRPALAGAALQVLDALGRTVLQQPAQAAPSGQRELDLSGFSTGIYSLRLDAKEGPIVRQLTVK